MPRRLHVLMPLDTKGGTIMTTDDLIKLCEPLVGRPLPASDCNGARWWRDAAAALAKELAVTETVRCVKGPSPSYLSRFTRRMLPLSERRNDHERLRGDHS